MSKKDEYYEQIEKLKEENQELTFKLKTNELKILELEDKIIDIINEEKGNGITRMRLM